MAGENEGIVVVKLHKSGMKTAGIVRTINFDQRTVYRIVKCFGDIGGTVDRPRSGRPTTVTTTENIRTVHRRFQRDAV